MTGQREEQVFAVGRGDDLEGALSSAGETSPLTDGDRVVIRYIDKEPSRPEFYTISETVDDQLNGYLLLGSPLGQALTQASPGDEFTFKAGETERSALFVSVETAAAQAA